jgi:hypothetical protein
MDNWALVIGVNEYRTPEHALTGAVNDAVEMTRWLLDVGGVKPRHLYLHLSGASGKPLPVRPRAADRGAIIDGMEDLLARSGGQGGRFYFYFAGHGLSSSVNAELQSAILPCDFRAVETDRSFTVASLFALLSGTDFEEQYFFIDACRNIPFDTDAVLGRYPKPRPSRTPPSPQFVMYATQPGVKAIEVRRPNDEHGAFTSSLLSGMGGTGAAKAWNDDVGDYSVRWDSLFRYVEAQVRAKQLAAGSNASGLLIQVPQQYGERGSQNPVLSRLIESSVTRQRLAIRVVPTDALLHAKLLVTDLSGLVESVAPPLADPIPLDLMPRTYGLRTEAVGYRPLQRLTKVDFYESCVVDIPLAPEDAASSEPDAQVITRGDGGQHLVFYVARGDQNTLPTDDATGSLEIRAHDPLAWLELATSAGEPLKSGAHSLWATGLKPHFYRASLLSPDGSRSEQLVEVVAGKTTHIELVPPPAQMSATLAWALADGGFKRDKYGVIQPSEAVGSAYFLKLSTLLALAAGAATDTDQTYGAKLRKLGVPSFDEAAGRDKFASGEPTGGAYLLVGDEFAEILPAAQSIWYDAQMVCAPTGNSPLNSGWQSPLNLLPAAPAIAFAAVRLPPGPHGLRLQMRTGTAITLPVTVMPGWMALLVITRETNQAFEFHHYQMPLHEMPELRQHREESTAFAALRRVELLQRMVQAGRLTPTRPDVELLLYDKWRDPIAGCLGGYLLHRSGKHQEMQRPAENLVRYFPWLPDSHLLLALAREHSGALEAAKEGIRESLRRGLPVFRDGLVALVAAAGRLTLDAELKIAISWLSNVPDGSLFSISVATHAIQSE